MDNQPKINKATLTPEQRDTFIVSGKKVLISYKDRAIFRKYNWRISNGYLIRNFTVEGKRKREYYHRHIMQPPKDKVIDHINHNSLDNRRQNLRVTTQASNCRNRKTAHGVSYNKHNGYWYAKMRFNGKFKYLGCSKSRAQAMEYYVQGRRREIASNGAWI